MCLKGQMNNFVYLNKVGTFIYYIYWVDKTSVNREKRIVLFA